MFLSEIKIYEFLKDKLKFLDSDAKKYAKQMSLAEEEIHTKIKEVVSSEIQSGNFANKQDIASINEDMVVKHDLFIFKQELQLSIKELSNNIDDRFGKVDKKFDKLDYKFDKLDERLGKLEVVVAKNTTEIVKWVITFYALMTGLTIGAIKLFF